MRIFLTIFLTLLFQHSAIAEDPPLRGDAEQAQAAWPLIDDGALVIDVRSEEEFQNGHLPGAINVAHTDTEALIELIGPDPEREVVLYCGSGKRAENAKLALEEAGFTGIYNASGLDALLATQAEQDGNP